MRRINWSLCCMALGEETAYILQGLKHNRQDAQCLEFDVSPMRLQKMEKQIEAWQHSNIQNEIPIDTHTSLQTSLSGFWEEISKCSSRNPAYMVHSKPH